MGRSNPVWVSILSIILAVCILAWPREVRMAQANTAPQPLPLQLDWSDTGLITSNDDWSGVPWMMGFLGERLGSKTEGVNPQNILVDGTNTTVSLVPDQTDPNTLGGAGVAEFEIPDPTIGLSGSSAPHAPFLLISLSTRGMTGVTISYDVRDLESSRQDAVQQVALHYRLGDTGDFTNLPAGYVADATEPNAATKVTHVSVILPAAADNQPLVQVRIMTANAVGKDEWIGIDNFIIDGTPMPDDAPYVISVTLLDGAVNVPVDSGLSVTFSEPVSLSEGWFSLDCAISGPHTVSVTISSPVSYELDPAVNFAGGETCTAAVYAAFVSDLDHIGPDHPVADFTRSFTTKIFRVFLPLIMR